MKIKRIFKWAGLTTFVTLIAWLFVGYWMSTNDCEQITRTPTHPMKAILSCEYGAQNLRLNEIEKPVPANNEVLVRVHAASLNPADGHMIRDSLLARLFS